MLEGMTHKIKDKGHIQGILNFYFTIGTVT